MCVDETDGAWFFCCTDGMVPLTEIADCLRAEAERYARAAGMQEPAVYARWLLAQYGLVEMSAYVQESPAVTR